ncbi:hypothetical protein [Niabella sp.]|uniref:hypothetical protein n=1 Tax=Niabella sp. TaxID=1962976 RepID=UPI00261804D7|nr:hypothetical protein [Niabella sp.]
MKEQDHIETILNSLDDIRRAEARPFMHTRVMARLREESNFWTRASSMIAKPAVAVCCLVTIMTVNVYLIVDGNSKQRTETVSAAGTESDILQNENFILASNTSYDFNK